jgi:hypothetical protein
MQQTASIAGLRGSLRSGVAAALCTLLALQPLPAVAAKKKAPSTAGQIQGDARILHTLNRLTFGPRPGELAEVRQQGLDRWFELQLHPEKIDDSSLQAKLDNFPAMKLEQGDLLRRYPSPQVLRQVEQGRLPMPTDPVEAAIYRDGIARYRQAKKKQEEKNAAMAKSSDPEMMSKPDEDQMAALPGDGVDPSTPSMAEHNEQFFNGLEAVKIVNLPPDQRMNKILALDPAQLASFRRALTPAEMAAAAEGLTPQQREVLMALSGGPGLVGTEVLATRMLRDVYSERELQAVMTDFWLNHFNVYIRKNQNEPYLLATYEREAIRTHALGKFEDLLVATAKSPGMLVYLDNAQSVGPDSPAAQRAARLKERMPNAPVAKGRPHGLNENYARELMELHTLGVNGGYTQADVTQVAKVFTGWTVEPLRSGDFQFEERRHEPGSKTVMGKTIREGGEREGIEVLHMLATSPATARFISNKLAVRFVSDTPPPALVDRMTRAYLSTDGNIADVLRAMFNSPEFWSPAVERAKMKTPLEFVVSAVRATGADVENPLPLVRALDKLGMPLYGMQTPNGYNWAAEPWVSTGALVSRMNFAITLSGNRVGGTFIDWAALLGTAPSGGVQNVAMTTAPDPSRTKESQLEHLLIGHPVSEQTRTTVLQQVDGREMQVQAERDFSIRPRDMEPMGLVLNAGGPAQRQRPPLDRDAATMAGLLLGSPEFQRR